MQTEHLAMPTMPIQSSIGNLYSYEEALKIGTIFPELNKPFFAAEDNLQPTDSGIQKDPQQQERELLAGNLHAVSFALDDLVLFLDTHPKDEEAIQLRRQLIETRKKLLKEYDEKFYPLTRDCAGFWTEGPMPWEGACI